MARCVAVVLVTLVLAPPVSANFGWFRSSEPVVVYYAAPAGYPVYYPAPCLAYPSPPPVVAPRPGVRTFATPTPAPPSTTAEPPPALNPKPAINESRFESRFYDVYPVATRGAASAASDRCSVVFWNLSGRAVVLKVDGQTRTLAAGANTTLDLRRQFVWQVNDREPQFERVAASDSALEIVLRR